MEVPICLQYIIFYTGIMYCMNLCHSKVVWMYYTGLLLFVGILAFGGWCPHGRSPTGVFIFGTLVYVWMGVWQDLKCHGSGVMQLIVPHLKMLSCPVCSRCPDVFQMCSCSSRCSCIILVFYYVMCPKVLMWQMCLLFSSNQIMFELYYVYVQRYVHGLCNHLSFFSGTVYGTVLYCICLTSYMETPCYVTTYALWV